MASLATRFRDAIVDFTGICLISLTLLSHQLLWSKFLGGKFTAFLIVRLGFHLCHYHSPGVDLVEIYQTAYGCAIIFSCSSLPLLRKIDKI
jgi:hypothetical protein